MTTESVPAGGDPRRLLSDVRALAHRVRLDQRLTWVALLVLAAVTLVGIPFDWFGMTVKCHPDGSCEFARRGMLYYWPLATLLAYAAIAFCYVRAPGREGWAPGCCRTRSPVPRRRSCSPPHGSP